MILSPEQAERFERLYGGLMDYTARQLAPSSEVQGFLNERPDSFGVVYQQMIWGKSGDLSIIEDFVWDCKSKLSDADVEEALSWKNATLGLFLAHRVGDETALMYGGVSFFVQGFADDLDEGTKLPAYICTVILPFDGLIVCGHVLVGDPLSHDEEVLAALNDQLRVSLDADSTARTAEEYARLIEPARTVEAEMRAEDERYEEEAHGNPDELLKGQYRSVLADVSWEERIAAFDKYEQEFIAPYIADSLDRYSTPGEPTTSLFECVMRLTKPEIVEMARGVKVSGPLSKMRKAELAEALVEKLDPDLQSMLQYYATTGLHNLEYLQKLACHRGRLDFRVSDIPSFDDVPLQAPPETWLFHNGDGYTLVMPDKYLDAFLALSDGVLEGYVERGRRVQAIVDRIAALVELRGIIPSSEVMDDIVGLIPVDESRFYLDALVSHLAKRTGDFRMSEVAGYDGAVIVHETLCEEEPLEGGYVELKHPVLTEDILKHSRLHQPRPGEGLESRQDVVSWIRGLPSYRALVSYLDAHMPEGVDERTWAVDYADDIVKVSRAFIDTSDEHDLLAAHGLGLSGAQRERVAELAKALIDDVPRWANNGWSQNELLDGGYRVGRDGFRSQGRESQGSKPKPKPKPKTRRAKGKRPHKKCRR